MLMAGLAAFTSLILDFTSLSILLLVELTLLLCWAHKLSCSRLVAETPSERDSRSHTGEPEAVYMDGKDKVFDVHTLVVEERPEDDVICRHTLRSPRLADVRSASLPEPSSNGASSTASSLPADSGTKVHNHSCRIDAVTSNSLVEVHM